MRVQVVLPMLIMKLRFTVELTWNMEMLSITCCQGDNQLLMWNFTKGENERITAYHWFFNEKTLICLDSETIGFHVTNLYKGRVERIGTLGIRLKNVSLTDEGEYTLYVKLDPEMQRNLQGISLTVVGNHLPYHCKPIITRQSISIISCSTPCERSSLTPEWIIYGTNETVGIGPYLTVDPHLTSEHLLCCLRSLTCHNDDQFKLCTQNHISFADNIEISTSTGRTLRDGNQNVNNGNISCLDADQVLMQNFESSREAAKDTSDTDSNYEDAVSANEVFAISGCNAELEWTLGETYLDVFACSLKVFNANGIEIAQKVDTTCKYVIDSSIYCEARNTNGEKWRFFVVLINVTQANSGKYTGQIQTGRGYEANITTDLNVIDKPRITELWKPVLYESFSVMCTTSYTSDCIIYYWKINGSDLQDSTNINATMSTLTYRNVTMMDNFSTLTCRAGIEKCGNILCNSSEDSDPYTVKVYFTTMHSNIHIDDKVSPNGSDIDTKEHSIYLLGVGLVIVAVSLIIVGALIFVTHRRKCDSRRLVSLAVNQPCAGPTNREITQDFLQFEKEDRPPLPIPAVPDSSYRIPRRSWYPNINRKSLSLHSFLNHDQALWRPIRQSLSLQSLIQLSHEIGRLANSDDSLCKPFCSKKGRRFSIGLSETGIRPEELYSKGERNKRVGYNEKNPDEISPRMINVRPQSSSQEQQELYSTINETSWSEYDYAKANMQVEHLQDKKRNTDAGNYDYDYAFLPPLQ